MRLQFLVSAQTVPYLNIAVENHLLATQEPGTVTLYLWRNRRTVVIGQNQNPFSEVNLDALLADGGYLMRRRTGGGAVYHDDGNLNFSFIASHDLYDKARQFGVLQGAVQRFGLRTEVSGRNDVLVACPEDDGSTSMRKFSGNAFAKAQANSLHHGTILIRSNMDDLARYLRPKPHKLLKHGVGSVQSRVANLGSLCADITAASIVQPLLDAFEQTYGGKVCRLDWDEVASRADVRRLRDEFASSQWLYDRWRNFSVSRSGHFEWGDVEVMLDVEEGRLRNVQIATDALDLQAVDAARALLDGAQADVPPAADDPVAADIVALIYSKPSSK